MVFHIILPHIQFLQNYQRLTNACIAQPLKNKKRKTDHQMNMTRQHEAIRMAKELKKEDN